MMARDFIQQTAELLYKVKFDSQGTLVLKMCRLNASVNVDVIYFNIVILPGHFRNVKLLQSTIGSDLDIKTIIYDCSIINKEKHK